MRRIFFTVFLFMTVCMSLAPPAMAAGTAAGTVISNQAYADYKDANGNAMTRVTSNTVTITVSRVAGVSIVPPTESSAAKNGDVITYLIQLFNTGNANDEQTFSYASSGTWTPSSVQMYWDANNDHLYTSGTDVLLTETSSGSKTYKTVNGSGVAVPLNQDDDYDVIMRVTVPATSAGATNNTSNVITITTRSDYDNTKTATGSYTTTVSASVISAVKTASVAAGSRTAVPGDTITFTIVLTNTGTASGTAVVITDAIPAGMTYKAGSITLGGVSKTDASDADAANFGVTTAGAVTVSAGTIAAGGTTTVTFQVTIDADLAAGTALTNQADIDYMSGTSALSVQTNPTTFFVGNAPSVSLSATTTHVNANPGDTVAYEITVANNGNLSDTIDLTYTSSAGWTWAIWADENGDGIAGNDGDYRLTDSDGDGVIDTGTIAAGGSLTLLAVAVVTPGTTNGITDSLTLTGRSSEDTSKSSTKSFTTTVTAPVLSVVKAVSPTGSQPPGTVLTYTVTVTNNGSGTATSVIITDMIPTYTTYVAGSIKTGTTTAGGTATLVSRSDDADGDGGQYDSGTNAVLVGAIGNVSLGASGVIVLEFKVTID